MKKLLIAILAFGLLLTPFAAYGQSAQTSLVDMQSKQTTTQMPAVSQSLVPEGQFALRLAAALGLGSPTTEAQAEDMLTSVGIEPENGWISNYPVTPVIIGELQNAVAAACIAQKIAMEKEKALQALRGIAVEFGLAISPGTNQYAESQAPTSSEYLLPSAVNNYYLEEGPPVITYYAPPPYYYYLYAWVPYPFWCSGYYFPGFFILNDFDFSVVGHFHGHPFHGLVASHYYDRRIHRYVRVDPTTRRRFRTPLMGAPGFRSPAARRDARSIFNHSFERGRSRHMTGRMNPRFEGTVPRRTADRRTGGRRNFERQSRNFRGPFSHAGRNFGVRVRRGFGRSSAGVTRSFGPRRSFGAAFARGLRTPLERFDRSRSFDSQKPFNLASSGGFGRSSEGFSRSFSGPSRSFGRPRSSFGGFHGGFDRYHGRSGFSHPGGFSGFRGRDFHGRGFRR